MKDGASRSVNLPMTLTTFKHFSCAYEVQLAINTMGTCDSIWPPHFDQVIPANLFR